MKQRLQASESFPVAALLSLSGGLMDAYSYLCRDEVFANAQTGNMLLFGVNLSTGNFGEAIRYLMPVLAFAFGIALAQIMYYRVPNTGRLHWRQAALVLEMVCLSAAAFFPQSLNLAANSLISFACGTQVQSFRKVNGSSIATTMCIGNLRAATHALCDYGFTKERQMLKNGFLYLSVIAMFVLGAVLGNFVVSLWRELSVLACLPFLLAAFLLMLNREDPLVKQK
ncbi:MAG TPA: YoaK family protein [Clostridia bacterium]|nr:YoaK family protein [Clostridia bacterium]